MKAALVLVAALVLAPTSPAAAATGGCGRCDTTVAGGEGSITVEHGTSDHVPGRGSATQGRGDGKHDYSYVVEYATPTCTGNRLHGDDALCTAAVTSCPAADQVRFWIWHQTVSVKVGPPEQVTKGAWHKEAGTYCLGPDDPGVPNIVLTLEAAHGAFERKVRDLPPPTVTTVPGPRTLVHYLTAFTAGRADAFVDAVTAAGATVHLHVRPESFHWIFGDGSTADTARSTTDHTYADKAARVIRVDVTWSGWFTIDGGREQYPIDPPATSTGVPSVVTVVEARAVNLS